MERTSSTRNRWPLVAPFASVLLLACGSAGSDGGSAGASGWGGRASNAEAGEGGSAGSGTTAGGVGAGATSGAGTAATSSGGTGGSSSADACAAFASARCERYQACLPARFAGLYSSLSDCEAATAATCPDEQGAPGTTRTSEQLATCATDTSAQSCADWLNESPASCAPAGTFANGTACEYDSQCVSTYCSRAAESWCGTCKARDEAEAACNASQGSCVSGLRCGYTCPGGSTCAAADKAFLCLTPKAEGAACTSVSECQGDLSCLGGVCSKGKGLGEACDASAPSACDPSADLSCVTGAAGASCVKNSYAVANASCNSATANYCSTNGACDGSDGHLVNGTPGKCMGPGADGEACSSDHLCRSPSLCLGAKCVAPVRAATCQ